MVVYDTTTQKFGQKSIPSGGSGDINPDYIKLDKIDFDGSDNANEDKATLDFKGLKLVDGDGLSTLSATNDKLSISTGPASTSIRVNGITSENVITEERTAIDPTKVEVFDWNNNSSSLSSSGVTIHGVVINKNLAIAMNNLMRTVVSVTASECIMFSNHYTVNTVPGGTPTFPMMNVHNRIILTINRPLLEPDKFYGAYLHANNTAAHKFTVTSLINNGNKVGSGFVKSVRVPHSGKELILVKPMVGGSHEPPTSPESGAVFEVLIERIV